MSFCEKRYTYIVYANSEDSGEMPQKNPFHQGLSSLIANLKRNYQELKYILLIFDVLASDPLMCTMNHFGVAPVTQLRTCVIGHLMW